MLEKQNQRLHRDSEKKPGRETAQVWTGKEEIIAEYAEKAGYELIKIYHEEMNGSDADHTRSPES